MCAMNRPTSLIAITLIALLVGLALGRALWQRHAAPPAPTTSTYPVRTQEIMATPITVQAPTDQIDKAAEIVFSIFRTVDAEMSEWKDTSPLSAVNANAGIAPVAVPDDLRAVIARAIEIGDLTDGSFDCTWAALWGLWDFKADTPRPPTDADIAARLLLIDYKAVRIDDEAGTVSLPTPNMLIGLGGIAKGHALDRAAAALRDAGINSYLLSAGGQVSVGDPPALTTNTPRGAGFPAREQTRGGRLPTPDTRPWRIGIRDPRGTTTDSFATIDLANTSLSTTGDYEKYFIHDGKRYHHILDPRTGHPSSGVRAVTVISPDATLADALSTALMILGIDRGMEIVQALPDVEVVFIDDAGSVHVSPGLAARLQFIHPPLAE